MKTVELAILNTEIMSIKKDSMFLSVENDASVIDILAAGDNELKKLLGDKPFPIDIFKNLLHLLYNPESNEFYEDIGVEARDQDKNWLPIVKDLSINIPDKSFIYLTPDAGC